MDLPQTEPGVGAEGLDPTPDELSQIATFDHALDWVGLSQATRGALVAALGGGTIRLRDIVYVPVATWNTITAGLRIPGVGDLPERDPSPIEQGQLVSVRRVARLRLGLRAMDALAVVPAAPVGLPAGALAGAGILAVPGSQAAPAAVSAEPALKLSLVIDPALESALVRMPPADIRTLYTRYVATRGGEPTEDIEPTIEQISAMAQVVAADLPPYADFSLFGPHGRRLLSKLTYQAWSFQPNGTWQRRELPGPPTFELWWSSFRVLRVVYLLLEIVDAETIDSYGELVRTFTQTYGDNAWFIVYNADVRMRAEQWERLRRKAERTHEEASAAGLQSLYDPAKPWKSVVRAALEDRNWWDENLHRPAILFLTRVRSAADAIDDRTAQPALEVSGPSPAHAGRRPPPQPQAQEFRLRSRSRVRKERAPRQRGGDAGAGGPPYTTTRRGHKICQAFQAGTCPKTSQSCSDLHICAWCRLAGHTPDACPAKGNQPAGPPRPPAAPHGKRGGRR